jgi:hypothetical protein
MSIGSSVGLKTVQLPQSVINSRRAEINSNTKVLSYPKDLGNHFMLFQFKKYNRFQANVKDSTAILDSVALPVPLGLKEEHSLDYKQGQVGAIIGAVFEDQGIQQYINNIWNNPADPSSYTNYGPLAGTGQRLWDSREDLVKGLLAQVFEGHPLSTAVTQTVAQIPNPHLVTAFHGVSLRKHNFSWLFAPETAADSDILQKIATLIRKHALPPYSGNKILLKYPSEVDISIGGLSSNYNYVFKTGVIEAIRYDRAPQHISAYFKGTGAPVLSKLDLVIMETEIFSREDYGISGPSPVSSTSATSQSSSVLPPASIAAITGAGGGNNTNTYNTQVQTSGGGSGGGGGGGF